MAWTTNIKRYRYTIIGFLVGVLIWGFGSWLEFSVEKLPFQFWALVYLHRTQPLIVTFDFAPVLFGLIGWLLDRQRNLLQVISRAKKEWEVIFDSFSDLIFVTGPDEKIVRCNHAVIDRLNTRYVNVIGRSISEILNSSEQGGAEEPGESRNGFSWLGRLYDVSTIPIEVEATEPKNLFILHDIT